MFSLSGLLLGVLEDLCLDLNTLSLCFAFRGDSIPYATLYVIFSCLALTSSGSENFVFEYSLRAAGNASEEALDRLPTSATCMNLLKLPPYRRFVSFCYLSARSILYCSELSLSESYIKHFMVGFWLV